MRVQSINLNLIPTGVMPIVHLSQYDRDADGALLFNIFNGPAPFNLTGCTATINGTKPDGNVYTYPCTVHSNFLTSAVYDQMTTVQGTHEAEIRISDGDSVVGTLNFQMAIEKAGVSEIDVSHTDVPTLLENIQASVDEAEYWAEQAAGAVAGVASFNGRHGSVLPVAGDYDASQISYGDRTVEDALDGMGGHTILNASGQEMPQRKNLRFAGANVSDDAENDTTNVTISGGGSGGSTITVTTTETSLYGESVIISDGVSTFTGVFDNTGVCVIDGVTATGTLTITSGAAVNQLNVPYYGNYTTFLSFWAATINVTTDPDIVSAIVKKDGVQIGTVNFTSGSGTYIAGSTGAYTFEVTVGGVVFSSPTVTVTEQTTYSTTIDIFSATLNISTSASSLYGKTITIKKGSTTVGTTAFSAQGSASYTVHETGTYTLDCEGYTATQAVSAQTTYNVTINAGLDLQSWLTEGGVSGTYADFSALEADEAAVRQLMLVHDAVDYLATASAGDSLMESVIGSDVCAKWINLSDYALDTLSANSDIADEMATADKYGYGEWIITDSTTTPVTWGAKGNVPIMTANNAPYGVASASSEINSSYLAHMAFNGVTTGGANASWSTAQNQTTNQWIRYQSVVPICVKRVMINNYLDNTERSIKNFKLQGCNDGSTWVDITPTALQNTEAQKVNYYDIENNDVYYLYHQLLILDNWGEPYLQVQEVQFYGRELSPLVPTMTANNAPKGEAFADSVMSSSYPAYKAFDNNTSDSWSSDESGTYANRYIGYKFAEQTCVKYIVVQPDKAGNNSVYLQDFKIKGSNNSTDGNNGEWTDMLSATFPNVADVSKAFVIDNNNAFKYCKLAMTSASYSANHPNLCQIKLLQFYGSDYSEKEFAQGSTRKTIYDHGVELETITGNTSGSDQSVSKLSNSLYMQKGSNNGAAWFNAPLDFSTGIYSNMYSKVGSKALGSTAMIVFNTSRTTELARATITPPITTLPVSSITGSNLVELYAGANDSTARNLTITEWWLE